MYFYKVGQPPQIRPNGLPVGRISGQSFQSFTVAHTSLSAPIAQGETFISPQKLLGYVPAVLRGYF